MINCEIPSQKNFLARINARKLNSEQAILDLARNEFWKDQKEKINSLADIVDGFTTLKGSLKQYLQDVVKIKIIESKEGEQPVVKSSILGPTTVVVNLSSSNPHTLFTNIPIAYKYFEQQVNAYIGEAIYIGRPESEHHAKPSELETNIQSLKNNLFKEIITFLSKYGENTDKYKKLLENSKEIKLFVNGNFHKKNYDAHYKAVLTDINEYLTGKGSETITIPSTGQKIPMLYGEFDNTLDLAKMNVYNAAVLLVNFDSVVKYLMKGMLDVNNTKINNLAAKDTYIQKVKGIFTEYFKDDDTSSGGVEEIQDKLSQTLISLIPVKSLDGNSTNQYLSQIDMYGLGAALHKFQVENFKNLIAIKDWTSLEDSPNTMLNWYLDNILEAHRNNYDPLKKNNSGLPSSLFKFFENKINLVYSLKDYLSREDIVIKEKNATSHSMNAIISHVLTNSISAMYATSYGDSHKVSIKDMHSHNMERVQIQESMYGYLKGKMNNIASIFYTDQQLKEELKELSPVKVREIIKKLTGIILNVNNIQDLIKNWKKGATASNGKIVTEQDELDAVIGQLKEIRNGIFRKTESSKDGVQTFIKENSIFNDIENIEKDIISLSFDSVLTTNDALVTLSGVKALRDVINAKLENVVVRVLTNIKKQNGDAVPTTVIPSLGFNDITLLKERHKVEESKTTKYKNFFVNNGGLLGTVVKLEEIKGDETKNSSDLTKLENFISHFQYGFLEALKPGSNSNFNLVIGNYADKSRILNKIIDTKIKKVDPQRNTSKSMIVSYSGLANKNTASKDVLSSEELWEESRFQGEQYFTDVLDNIFEVYKEFVPNLVQASTVAQYNENLKLINDFLSKETYETFIEKSLKSSQNFIKELHYSVYKSKEVDANGKEVIVNKLGINNVIGQYYNIYNNKKAFKIFVNDIRESFLLKYIDYGKGNVLLTKRDLDLFNKVKGDDESNLFRDIIYSIGIDYESFLKEFGTEDGDIITHYLDKNGEIVINPLLDKWLSANEFFRNEYLYMSLKPEYMHPAKDLEYSKDFLANLSSIENFHKESGARLPSMSKRNVSITGSTELPTKNLKMGVIKKWKVVVIDDFKAEIPTISGVNTNQAVHDGSSYLPYTSSKMIDNSYQGKGFSGAKKQLATFVTEFGSALKKDAESVLSNYNILNSKNSKINLKNKQKQVYELPIFIDNFSSGNLGGNNKFWRNGEYFAITSFTIVNNVFTPVVEKFNRITKVWERVENPNSTTINNLFDFWEVFGGEYSVDNDFKFNEGSNEMLFFLMTNYKVNKDNYIANIESKIIENQENLPLVETLESLRNSIDDDIENTNGYILKSRMIHVISNHSAFKSGASNVHTKDYWLHNKTLKFTEYNNSHMGVQLDATHEASGSKVKEVTQMISSLAQNIDTADQANEIYSSLANIIEKIIAKNYRKSKAKVDDKSNKEVLTEDKSFSKLYEDMSRKLILSIANSSTNDLAKVISETFENNELIPFSNQNFFDKFVQDMVSEMNDDFITRYYPGGGMILTPSHGIITVYQHSDGTVYSQSDIIELAKDFHYENGALPQSNEDIINSYINNNFENSEVDSSEIGFLDSYIDELGNVKTLDSIKKYYEFKNNNKNKRVTLSRTTTRDLKPQEIIFKDGSGITRNLFDLIPLKLKFLSEFSTPELELLKTAFINKFGLKSEEEYISALNVWQQRELHLLSQNMAPKFYDAKELLEVGLDNYFALGDNLTSIVIDDYKNHYYSDKYSVRLPEESVISKPAEMIGGNIYNNIFETGNDSMAKIRSKGPEYFKEKIAKYYEVEEGNFDLKIATEDRDVYVVYTQFNESPPSNMPKNKVITEYIGEDLVKFRVDDLGNKLYKIPSGSTVDIRPNYDIVYIPIVKFEFTKQEEPAENAEETANLEDSKTKKTKQKKQSGEFKLVKGWHNNVDSLLNSFGSDIRAIVPIFKNTKKLPIDVYRDTYQLFKRYSGYIPKTYEKFGHYLENYKDTIIDFLAKKTYASWEHSHYVAASRIPAQSMQSFMSMKNVSYFNTPNNEVYVSVWQIVIQGSDFDIDKVYVMGPSFNKFGHYETWNGAITFTDTESLSELKKMPLPKAKMTSVKINNAVNFQKPSIKPGVSELFESNPELASIGTQEQYSKYLDTIFPDSKVKDIVYHGTHVKFDKFERGKRNFDGRKTNTEGFHLIAAVDKEYYREKYKGLISAIVNFKNPVSANNGNYEAALEYLSKRDIEQFNAMGFDSGIKFINDEDGSLEYVAFEPEQIHILGSKQDMEGFKEFVSYQNEELDDSPENDITSEIIELIKSFESSGNTDFESLSSFVLNALANRNVYNRGEVVEDKYELISEWNGFNFNNEGLKLFRKILEKAKNNDELSINFNEIVGNFKNTGFTADQNMVKSLFDSYLPFIKKMLDEYNTNTKYSNQGQANFVVNSINSIIENPTNQILASSPVSLNELHKGAEKAEKLNEGRRVGILENLESLKQEDITPEIWNELVITFGNIIQSKDMFKDTKESTAGFKLSENIRKAYSIKNRVSSHDVLSFFKMQEDAIVGKKDVGIGANGMKVFFATSDYYNKYNKSLEIIDGEIYDKKSKKLVEIASNPKFFIKEFNLGDSLGKVVKTSIADVWMDENLKTAILNSMNLNDVEKTLVKFSQDGTAAMAISAFITGATDNAKELIMSKINALSEIAAMHLYMMMLGFTQAQIAEYMNSDIAQYVVSKLKLSNIFSDTGRIYVTDILKSYLDAFPKRQSEIDTFKNIYKGGVEISKLASLLKINQRTSADKTSMFNYLNNLNKSMWVAENSVLEKDLWKLSSDKETDINRAIDVILKNNRLLDYATVRNVLAAASSIKVTYIDESGQEKQKYVSMVSGKFDFRYYIHPENEAYREISVKYYNLFKNTLNIFDIIESSPHFKAMIKGLSESHIRSMKVSKKYNFVFNTFLDMIRKRSKEIQAANRIPNYMGNGSFPINVDEYMLNRAFRWFDNFVIGNWAKSGVLNEYTFSVKNLLETLKEDSFKVRTSNKAKEEVFLTSKNSKIIKADSEEDFIIDLTTDYGIANFKEMMETLVLPLLKSSKTSDLGELLKLKTVKNAYGLSTQQITAMFGLSSLNTMVNIAQYQKLLHSFNTVDYKLEKEKLITNINGKVINITDLFYLYNLFTNNEQYGDNRLTSMMQDYVSDKNSLAYKYLDYYRSIDKRELDLFAISLSETDLSKTQEKALEDSLISSRENSVIFSGLHKRGKLQMASGKRLVLQDSGFPINISIDLTEIDNSKIYSDSSAIINLLKNSNLIINFKCT